MLNTIATTGLNAHTGKAISGIEHLRQCLENIIMTNTDERIMLRDYGTNIDKEIDNPTSKTLFLKTYAIIADAIEKWETIPAERFTLKHISMSTNDNNKPIFTFKGDYQGLAIEVSA